MKVKIIFAAYIYTYISTYTHTYFHAHTYIYMHTYIHTHTYIEVRVAKHKLYLYDIVCEYEHLSICSPSFSHLYIKFKKKRGKRERKRRTYKGAEPTFNCSHEK